MDIAGLSAVAVWEPRQPILPPIAARPIWQVDMRPVAASIQSDFPFVETHFTSSTSALRRFRSLKLGSASPKS